MEKQLDRFRADVITLLQRAQKELPSKYLYDEKGSQLFDQITELDEYYVTRTESAIMEQYSVEMARELGSDVLLIEYGSGSSVKTRILLDAFDDLAGYVPIDISTEHLLKTSEELASDYPKLEVLPLSADYTRTFKVPEPLKNVSKRVVYYPGSTIGNFEPVPAKMFLERIAEVCGTGGGLLIGVDLKKDPKILHYAYNDNKGITAAFNLNLLERINRELGANFDLSKFAHYAFYNTRKGRIEMQIVSLAKQVVDLKDAEISFEKGESIWTESSYKYNLREFETLGASAGFATEKVWTDDNELFSIHYLTVR
jgi:dimethylhistidine N-methyltransferase